jgi:hypothetical protein
MANRSNNTQAPNAIPSSKVLGHVRIAVDFTTLGSSAVRLSKRSHWVIRGMRASTAPRRGRSAALCGDVRVVAISSGLTPVPSDVPVAVTDITSGSRLHQFGSGQKDNAVRTAMASIAVPMTAARTDGRRRDARK